LVPVIAPLYEVWSFKTRVFLPKPTETHIRLFRG
jgi:hypothetical protein